MDYADLVRLHGWNRLVMTSLMTWWRQCKWPVRAPRKWPEPSITLGRRTPTGSDKFSVEISRGERRSIPWFESSSLSSRRATFDERLASRSTDDGAAPPGYTRTIRLSLDGSRSSPARLRSRGARAGGDHVTLHRRRRRRELGGASSRDAGDKLPASGRPGLSRDRTGAGGRRPGDHTVYYLVAARRRAHQSYDRTAVDAHFTVDVITCTDHRRRWRTSYAGRLADKNTLLSLLWRFSRLYSATARAFMLGGISSMASQNW